STDRAIASFADIVVTNSNIFRTEWEKLGARQVVALPISACDSELHGRAKPALTVPLYDVSFVGSLDESLYQSRLEVLRQLADFRVAIWSVTPRAQIEKCGLGAAFKGTLSRTECIRVYSDSRIVINIHSEQMADGGNLST